MTTARRMRSMAILGACLLGWEAARAASAVVNMPVERVPGAGNVFLAVDPAMSKSLSDAAPLILKADPSLPGYEAFRAMSEAGGDAFAPIFDADNEFEGAWKKLAKGSWQRAHGIKALSENILLAAQIGADDAATKARDLILKLNSVMIWDFQTAQYHADYLSRLNLEAAEMDSVFGPVLAVDPELRSEMREAHRRMVAYIRGLREFQLKGFAQGESAKLNGGNGDAPAASIPTRPPASPLPTGLKARRLLATAKRHRDRLKKLYGWSYGEAEEVISTLGFVRLTNGHEHAKHLIYHHPLLEGFRFTFPMGHSGEVTLGFMRDIREGVDLLIALLSPVEEPADRGGPSGPPRPVPTLRPGLEDAEPR